MNLKKLYDSLNESEKIELLKIFKEEKIQISKQTYASDWIDDSGASVRLWNIIKSNFRGEILVSDITKEDLLKCRSAGIKCWEELQLLRGDI